MGGWWGWWGGVGGLFGGGVVVGGVGGGWVWVVVFVGLGSLGLGVLLWVVVVGCGGWFLWFVWVWVCVVGLVLRLCVRLLCVVLCVLGWLEVWVVVVGSVVVGVFGGGVGLFGGVGCVLFGFVGAGGLLGVLLFLCWCVGLGGGCVVWPVGVGVVVGVRWFVLGGGDVRGNLKLILQNPASRNSPADAAAGSFSSGRRTPNTPHFPTLNR